MPEHAGQPGAGWPARRMPMNTRTPLQMSLISRHQARRLRRHAVLLRQGLSGWRVEADTPAWCRNAGLGNATGRECAAAGRNPDKGRQVAGFLRACGWLVHPDMRHSDSGTRPQVRKARAPHSTHVGALPSENSVQAPRRRTAFSLAMEKRQRGSEICACWIGGQGDRRRRVRGDAERTAAALPGRPPQPRRLALLRLAVRPCRGAKHGTQPLNLSGGFRPARL